MTRRKSERLHVTIVSDNAETRDGLEAYLRRAGATTNGTKFVEKLFEMTPPSAAVVVLFPDDFDTDAVIAALTALRSRRPSTLPILVTRETKLFDSLILDDGEVAPLVIAKPAWGWTILDAIRAADVRAFSSKRTS